MRKNWGTEDTGCNILHVDMDTFFASVELLDSPELRGTPVVVGGKSNRGVVTAATYEARALGIHAGMPIFRARTLCPKATFLPGRMERYRDISARVMQVLSKITPIMEQVSVDEAFLDVSGSLLRLGTPMEIAAIIRAEIRKEVDLPASVGLSPLKTVAKIASGFAKPDGILVIPASATKEFLRELPISALWGVGKRSQVALERLGIETVANIADMKLSRLQKVVGEKNAHRLQELARGIDPRKVEPYQVEKSVGTETTFDSDITNQAAVALILLEQCHRVAEKLRARSHLAGTVSIKVRAADFKTVTRSQATPSPTDLARDLIKVAQRLFESLPFPKGGVRLVGVRAEKLVSRDQGFQDSFDEDGRSRATEIAMDDVNKRFGRQSIKPASILEPSRNLCDR